MYFMNLVHRLGVKVYFSVLMDNVVVTERRLQRLGVGWASL